MRRRGLVLLAALLAGACGRGGRVRAGDSVNLRYELSAGGAVIESDFDGEPVKIVAGAGDVPPGVDAALIGMAPGEEKVLDLSSEKAFGPRDPALVQTMALKDLGALAAGLKPGQKVSGFRDGKAETALVTSVGGGKAVLDFNSPLAGKDVRYRIRVVSLTAGGS